MTFSGFGEHAVDFYDWLAADNSKPFWEDHKALYLEHVRSPMTELLAELEPEFADGFGTGKVFRPFRDVRFSKDKTPYKDHCGAVIEPGRGAGAYYVQISAAGLRAGGGCYHLAPGQLARYRAAAAGELHGTALRSIVDELVAKGWQIRGEQLKNRPRDYPAEHPRLDLIRHKQLYGARVWEPDDTLHERGCLDRVAAAWRELRPLNEWFRDHVGVEA